MNKTAYQKIEPLYLKDVPTLTDRWADFKWPDWVRRTLQRHFQPLGGATWSPA